MINNSAHAMMVFLSFSKIDVAHDGRGGLLHPAGWYDISMGMSARYSS